MISRIVFILCLITLIPFASARADVLNRPAASQVYLMFGADLEPRLKSRVSELVGSVPGVQVVEISEPTPFTPPSGSLVLSFGDTSITRKFIDTAELNQQGPEGFIVRSGVAGGVTYVTTQGAAAQGERTSITGNRGLSFGTYELLQDLGFRFLHPLKPHVPSALGLSHAVNIVEHPRWPTRSVHLHTQHPIELTDLLNGWGPGGTSDLAGWTASLPNWELTLEWLIAHRQNGVDWVLLDDKVDPKFNYSQDRWYRLNKLVTVAHQWGILAGVSFGITLQQQNCWHLIEKIGTDQQDKNYIHLGVAWLMAAGFDFASVAAGLNEFQSAPDTKTLFWLNTVTAEVESQFNRPVYAYAHISKGQQAKDFKDPDTNLPLNLNYLPHFADPRLGVNPHTVELYGLDDPAPTYGQTDFSDMHRFLSMEAGTRPVVWYPETSYWIGYDIDVPLFLPVYGERRLHDLRIIAHEEDAATLGRGSHKGSRIQGQILFTSGWEWSYWLPNLVAMHAAWNPHLEKTDDQSAWKEVLREIIRPEASEADELIGALTDTVTAQNDLLIQGKLNGKLPTNFEKLSGITYLSGNGVWDIVNATLASDFGIKSLSTKPNRIPLRAFTNSVVSNGISYPNQLQPLLSAMDTSFDALATRFEALSRSSFGESVEELRELIDSSRITALRARQVHMLYDTAAAGALKQSDTWKAQRLSSARAALDQAALLSAMRQPLIRSNPLEVADWRAGPTVYRFGYIWTSQSLYYWWRDEAIVVKDIGICRYNIVNPADDVFSDGQKDPLYGTINFLTHIILPLWWEIGECVSPNLSQAPDIEKSLRPSN
jgi:hypothetical protein